MLFDGVPLSICSDGRKGWGLGAESVISEWGESLRLLRSGEGMEGEGVMCLCLCLCLYLCL